MRKSLLVLDQGFPTINGGVGGSVRSGIEFADRLQTQFNSVFICSVSNTLSYGIVPFTLAKYFLWNRYLRGFLKRLCILTDLVYIIRIRPDIIILNNDIITNRGLLFFLKRLTKIRIVQYQRAILRTKDFDPEVTILSVSHLSMQGFKRAYRVVPNLFLSDVYSHIQRVNTKDIEFVYFGRVIRKKGLEVIIDYLAKHSYTLSIVGDVGDSIYERELLDLIDRTELKVNWIGWNERPIECFKKKRIIACHYSHANNPEPFGRIYVECLYAKIPVMSWGNSGALELEELHENSFNYLELEKRPIEDIYNTILERNAELIKRLKYRAENQNLTFLD